MTVRTHRILALSTALAAALAWAAPVAASGPSPTGPWAIDVFGGSATEQGPFYDGNIGVLTAQSPRAQLFAVWRILHGLPVGAAAGKSLGPPCCGDTDQTTSNASQAWIDARKAVPGGETVNWIDADREVEGAYGGAPNCLPDAFTTATATLQARVTAYGATSPWVAAWRDGQDQVFKACSSKDAALAPLDAAAPAWLVEDRAYQAAALAFYKTDYAGAADAFARIARERASPWRPMADYLVVRALVRAAVISPGPDAFAKAHAALKALERAPERTYGRETAPLLEQVLACREQPERQRDLLATALLKPQLPDTAASDFKDLYALSEKTKAAPELVDWIDTLKAAQVGAPDDDSSTPEQDRSRRDTALAHAREQWAKTHDTGWLLAALSLTDVGDPAAAGLAEDARKVPPGSPGYLTAVYQRLRLTLGSSDEAASRVELDAILTRRDLSTTARNLFTAQRMQLAENTHSFARLALRKRLADTDMRGNYNEQTDPTSVFDGDAEKGTLGLGDDARALIDRMPLAQRAALADDPALPAKLQLDVALTSWVRAVLLQEDAQIDALSGRLKALLPQMADDWARVTARPHGPAKRFAEEFALAKLPGAKVDLVDYQRPEGTVEQFQGYWPDWMILTRGQPDPTALAPAPSRYYPDTYTEGGGDSDDKATPEQQWAKADLVCFSLCGKGDFPVRVPDFIQTRTGAQERGYFVNFAERYGDQTPQPTPAGAADVWEELLAYVQAHPKDPLAPETLHWLIHIGHYGQGHNHSGKRAFELLHQRYPTSVWAAKNKYYYD